MAERSSSGSSSSGSPSRWSNWLHLASDPLFLLNRQRRLRYVNPAFEQVTGFASDVVLGTNCSGRRSTDPLGQTLRVPREVLKGRVETVRRAIPPARSGPPWWELTFVPLTSDEGILGILGRIRLIGIDPSLTSASPRLRGLSEPLMALRQQSAARYSLDLLRGEGFTAERLLSQVRLGMQSKAAIWLTGEPGSGKHTTARVIHHQGITRELSFARIDPTGLPAHMVAAMLFGTGGLLSNPQLGTIYIAEPTRLPGEVQHALVDWADDRSEQSPRIIIGSRHRPIDAVEMDRLLPELMSRFAVFEMTIAPLRDRMNELPRLVSRMLERAQMAGAPAIASIAPELMDVLRAYRWPENLRELAHTLNESAKHTTTGRLDANHLPRSIREAVRITRIPGQTTPAVGDAGMASVGSASGTFLGLDPILEQVERRIIQSALRKSGGNRAAAAEMLGIWRTRLLRRIEALKIED